MQLKFESCTPSDLRPKLGKHLFCSPLIPANCSLTYFRTRVQILLPSIGQSPLGKKPSVRLVHQNQIRPTAALSSCHTIEASDMSFSTSEASSKITGLSSPTLPMHCLSRFQDNATCTFWGNYSPKFKFPRALESCRNLDRLNILPLSKTGVLIGIAEFFFWRAKLTWAQSQSPIAS